MTIIATDDMVKGDRQPLLQQQQPQSMSNPPPPRYESTFQAPSWSAIPAPVWTSQALPGYAPLQRKNSGWRFLKAFGLALFALWLLSSLVSSFKSAWWSTHRTLGVLSPTFPSQGDGVVIECRRQEDLQYTFRGEPEKAFYLLSRGNTATGIVKLVEAPELDADTVFVTVNVSYTDDELFTESKVCLLEDGSKRGLGIFAPNWRGPLPRLSRLQYTVVYHIPTSSKPTVFKSFETSLSNFAHSIELSEGAAVFDLITLRSSNAAIIAKAIEGHQISLVTSNGQVTSELVSGIRIKTQSSNAPISGRFVSNESISLLTSNGAINSDVDLTSANKPVHLALHTSNGKINGTATLHRDAEDFSTTWFTVDLRTSNDALNYAVVGAHEHLNLVARTSNSHASVRLPAAYEGAVTLRSSNAAAPRVDFVGPREDPTGRGRTWSVRALRTSRNEWAGEVGWDVEPGQPRPADWGSVEVTTSNGHVGLLVDNVKE